MFVSYVHCPTYVCCVNGKSTDLGFSAISAPARKINPSFIGAISCHRREFHTSGECTIQALSHPRVPAAGSIACNILQHFIKVSLRSVTVIYIDFLSRF